METTVQPQMGLNFEQVWAALMESRAHQEEFRVRQEELSQQIKETFEMIKETSENQKKTDEQMKETDKQIKRISKNLGGLGDSLGSLIETLIAARLWEKFDAYPYNLKRAYQRVPLYDENNKILSDIDILLANGGWGMVVEVKRDFYRIEDVEHHLKRMELIKKYPPAECRGKKLLGAIAGGTVDPAARDSAHKAGFFVLELTGESVRLAPTPEDFTAREW